MVRNGKNIPATLGGKNLKSCWMPINTHGALTFSVGNPSRSAGPPIGASKTAETRIRIESAKNRVNSSFLTKLGTDFTILMLAIIVEWPS